jgi:protein-disulfide isomerase
MDESKEPGQEEKQEVPESTGPEPGQEPPASGEPVVAEGAEGKPAEVQPPHPALSAAAGQRNPLATAAAIALVAVVAVGIFLGGFFTHAATSDDDEGVSVQVQAPPAGQPAPAPAPQPTPELVPATVDDDPAWGPEDAAVTVIEFSDFQCAFCARFYAETLPQLNENYGDRIRFVFRDFPLTSIHPFAVKAAEAAECADDQEAFWEYHDLLFENQSALDVDSLKGYAADAGLDTEAFDECLDSGKYTSEVANDLQDGVAAGVRGTPAFFVNGSLISGAQPYAVFQQVLDAALAEAGE